MVPEVLEIAYHSANYTHTEKLHLFKIHYKWGQLILIFPVYTPKYVYEKIGIGAKKGKEWEQKVEMKAKSCQLLSECLIYWACSVAIMSLKYKTRITYTWATLIFNYFHHWLIVFYSHRIFYLFCCII